MNLRWSHRGALIRSALALLLVLMALLPSPVARAHMNGSMGPHVGGRAGAAAHANRGAANVPGTHHRGLARRSFHHHAGVIPFAFIGGAGLLYPNASPYHSYPYGYDWLQVTPVWSYCDAAGAYYPYVMTCPEEWRLVPSPYGQAYPLPPQ